MNRLAWLGLAALAIIAGCSDGTSDPTESEESQGQDLSSSHFANDKAAFDYFLAKGLKNYQVAGIIGNLDQESGMNPAIAQFGGGPGRGIAQWSTGGRWDADKNDNAVAFAAQEKKDVKSLSLQLDFIWHELTSFPSYGLAELKASKNVHDAAIAFQDKFEACGECVATNRINYAESALTAYGDDKVATPDAGTKPADGGAGAVSEIDDVETPSQAATDDGTETAETPAPRTSNKNSSVEEPADETASGGCSAAPGNAPVSGWLLALALVFVRRKRQAA